MSDLSEDTARQIHRAMSCDQTIDIVTLGAKTRQWRTVEIWFTRVDDRIIICGTPGASADGGSIPQPRHWLANLKRHPDFWFCFKESLQFCIPARAVEVTDTEERRLIMSHPATVWYREHAASVDDLVAHSPIVEVQPNSE